MMSDNIKAWITDIDGTMSGQSASFNDRVISTWRALSEIFPCGVITGKNLDYVRGIISATDIKISPIITENGGCAFGIPEQGNVTYLKKFVEIIELCIFSETILFQGKRRKIYIESKKSGITLFPPLTESPEYTEDIEHGFREIVDKHALPLTITRYRGDGAIDIFPQDVNKWNGLVKTCKGMGINPSQVVISVDEMNDASIVRPEIGAAICPANACPEIKKMVSGLGDDKSYVAKEDEGIGTLNGILYFAQKRFFGKKSDEIAKIISKSHPALNAHMTKCYASVLFYPSFTKQKHLTILTLQ